MNMWVCFKKFFDNKEIGLFVCMMVLFFTATLVFAQDQAPSADEIVAKMQSKLNLTQDQVSAITPIIEKYMSKSQELRDNAEDGSVEKYNLHGQLKKLKQDEKQELSQVLSEDQLSQWEKMQSHGHKHSSANTGGSETSGGGDTPAQQ